MMNTERFEELIAFGREQVGVEFKGPGSRADKAFFALVVRAMLAMANRRDGGIVIIGVSEDNRGALVLNGLTKEQQSTWFYDNVADSIDEYADPSIAFDLTHVISSGRNFVALEVHEFVDIPILCRRTYADTLKKGACYTRPRRKPETVEIPSQVDMRDLLDLAIEKGLRKFLMQAHRAGLAGTDQVLPDDNSRFNNQLQGFMKSL